jgi:hypothetical protein
MRIGYLLTYDSYVPLYNTVGAESLCRCR